MCTTSVGDGGERALTCALVVWPMAAADANDGGSNSRIAAI